MRKIRNWFWEDLVESTIVHWSPRELIYFIFRLVLVSFGLGVAVACIILGEI